MSGTADGSRAGTKITKATKIMKTKWVFVVFVSAREPSAVPPMAAPRYLPPPFDSER